MDKEKCLLDFSQKLGLADKEEENTSITFCCCVQKTYFKKYSPLFSQNKMEPVKDLCVHYFLSNCFIVTSLIPLLDQMSYMAALLYFLQQIPLTGKINYR